MGNLPLKDLIDLSDTRYASMTQLWTIHLTVSSLLIAALLADGKFSGSNYLVIGAAYIIFSFSNLRELVRLNNERHTFSKYIVNSISASNIDANELPTLCKPVNTNYLKLYHILFLLIAMLVMVIDYRSVVTTIAKHCVQ